MVELPGPPSTNTTSKGSAGRDCLAGCSCAGVVAVTCLAGGDEGGNALRVTATGEVDGTCWPLPDAKITGSGGGFDADELAVLEFSVVETVATAVVLATGTAGAVTVD